MCACVHTFFYTFPLLHHEHVKNYKTTTKNGILHALSHYYISIYY